MPRWTKRRKSRMNFIRAGLSSNRKRDEFPTIGRTGVWILKGARLQLRRTVPSAMRRQPSLTPAQNRCNHAERQCELASPATCLRRPRLVVLGPTIPRHAVAARAQKFLLELRRSRAASNIWPIRWLIATAAKRFDISRSTFRAASSFVVQLLAMASNSSSE